MDVFFCQLREAVERSISQLSPGDDFQIEDGFMRIVLQQYTDNENAVEFNITRIQVCDGPNIGSLSVNLWVGVELRTREQGLPETDQKLDLFFKCAPMGSLNCEPLNEIFSAEIEFYGDLLRDMRENFRHHIKGEYRPPVPELVFHYSDKEDKERRFLVLKNLRDQGFYCPKDRILNKNEMKSALKSLAKFHADGIVFLRQNQTNNYKCLEANKKRLDFLGKILDKFLDPYLNYLENYSSVLPAVFIIRRMRSSLLEVGYPQHFGKMQKTFNTITHSNLWNGNIFFKNVESANHEVVFVDWSHVSLSPLTSDLVHLLFSCCGSDIANQWSDLLNEYYDYLKIFLKYHNLDRSNLKLDFENFYKAVAQSVKAEFIQEGVLNPLSALCGQLLMENKDVEELNFNDIFDSDVIEDDVIPGMEMAMSLGIANELAKTDPEVFNDAAKRGNLLSGRLVTRKESINDPVPACVRRRRRASLALRSPRRSKSRCGDLEEGGGGDSEGNCTPQSTNLSRSDSAVGDPGSEEMEALKRFQATSSRVNLTPASETESLGQSLKMIKKRRSLFEHASAFGLGHW